MEAAAQRPSWDSGRTWRAVGFAVLASLFVSLAQWQFKGAALEMDARHPAGALISPALWVGVLAYLFSLYWTLKAYRWGDISFVLPIVSLCNVWNVLLGYFALGEPLSSMRLGGTAIILLGIVVLTR